MFPGPAVFTRKEIGLLLEDGLDRLGRVAEDALVLRGHDAVGLHASAVQAGILVRARVLELRAVELEERASLGLLGALESGRDGAGVVITGGAHAAPVEGIRVVARSGEEGDGGGEEAEFHGGGGHGALHQLLQKETSFATAATALWMVFFSSRAVTHASKVFASH